MSRNYQALARAIAPEIPDDKLASVVGPLETLEAAFRPLAKEIDAETEPAYVVLLPPEWFA